MSAEWRSELVIYQGSVETVDDELFRFVQEFTNIDLQVLTNDDPIQISEKLINAEDTFDYNRMGHHFGQLIDECNWKGITRAVVTSYDTDTARIVLFGS